MKLDSRKPEMLYEQMLQDSGITREKFDGYNVNREHYIVVEIPRYPGEVKPTYVLALASSGARYNGPSDHRYVHRETAEIVCKVKNLWLKAPRERGTYADLGAVARAWVRLAGHQGRVSSYFALGSQLERARKIEAAGFGRYRIAPTELAAHTQEVA